MTRMPYSTVLTRFLPDGTAAAAITSLTLKFGLMAA